MMIHNLMVHAIWNTFSFTIFLLSDAQNKTKRSKRYRWRAAMLYWPRPQLGVARSPQRAWQTLRRDGYFQRSGCWFRRLTVPVPVHGDHRSRNIDKRALFSAWWTNFKGSVRFHPGNVKLVSVTIMCCLLSCLLWDVFMWFPLCRNLQVILCILSPASVVTLFAHCPAECSRCVLWLSRVWPYWGFWHENRGQCPGATGAHTDWNQI